VDGQWEREPDARCLPAPQEIIRLDPSKILRRFRRFPSFCRVNYSEPCRRWMVLSKNYIIQPMSRA
jgi:hypothetical protein